MDGVGLEFADIYSDYQPKILRYMSRMLGNAEAEEATQEVFARVANSLAGFRGDSQLSTWLYRIATNAALDRLRAAPRPMSVPLEEADEVIPEQNAWTGERKPTPEAQVYRAEMNECIRGLIDQLPDDYRAVLLLADFEGLKNQEMADILQVTVDTVKIRLHRARERLRAAIAAHCGPEWIEDNEFIPELK